MKKVFFVLFSMFLLVGCHSQESEKSISDRLYKQYQNYYNHILKQKDFATECEDFQIRLILNETNKGNIRYDIIIEQPTIEMKNIQAIAIVENEKKYNSPSIGLLEEEKFSLIPNKIDKEKGIYKGINLSGITSLKEFDIKIYITYQSSDKNIERYIIIHGYAS